MDPINVLSVIGITKSGKTTVAETIISGLKKRNFSVGSVKEIHYEKFTIDTEGTNTYRHKMAGAEIVSALGLFETDILIPEKLDIMQLLSYYSQEYVVLEGVSDIVAPKIITAHSIEEIDKKLDDNVFAISGRIAGKIDEYRSLPVINCLKEPDRLVNLVIEKAFEVLPNVEKECCGVCGFSCYELCSRILKKESTRNDCVISKSNVKLFVNGRQVDMVPFVQNILKNAVLGVVSELDGYQPNAKITVELGDDILKCAKMI